MTRIFHSSSLKVNNQIKLDDDAFNHVIRVLRMKVGYTLTFFDGTNYIFDSKLIKVNKKYAIAAIENAKFANRESPLFIHLGQVISLGNKMDFTIQKSVELGVSSITPLFSERCCVKLSGERLAKNVLHNGKKSLFLLVSNVVGIKFQWLNRLWMWNNGVQIWIMA